MLELRKFQFFKNFNQELNKQLRQLITNVKQEQLY